MEYALNVYELDPGAFYAHRFAIMPVSYMVLNEQQLSDIQVAPGFAFALIWRDSGKVNLQLGYINKEGQPEKGFTRQMTAGWKDWNPNVRVRLDAEDRDLLVQMPGFSDALDIAVWQREKFYKAREAQIRREQEATARAWREQQAAFEQRREEQEAERRRVEEQNRREAERMWAEHKAWKARRLRASARNRWQQHRDILPLRPDLLPIGPSENDLNHILYMFDCLAKQRLPNGRPIPGGWRETLAIVL